MFVWSCEPGAYEILIIKSQCASNTYIRKTLRKSRKYYLSSAVFPHAVSAEHNSNAIAFHEHRLVLLLSSRQSMPSRRRTFDGNEVSPTLVGDGLREQSLAASRRAVQEHTGRNRQA